MKTSKNNQLLLLLILSLFSGCLSFSFPTKGPLEEKILEGTGQNKILIIDIHGIIANRVESNPFRFEEDKNLLEVIKEQLIKASKDNDVLAIILNINSPGGDVTTTDIIYNELKKFKKKTGKLIIAQMMNVAASGGYYLSVAADKIIAHPTTVIGSIGVIAHKLDASLLFKKIGIVDDSVKSGDKKDMGSILRPMSVKERKIYQSVIDGLYSRFLDVILRGRKGISRDKLKKIADGRIFLAKTALKYKLIDNIGYLEDTISLVKKELKVEQAKIIKYKSSHAYVNNIYSKINSAPANTINIINIDTKAFLTRAGIKFMYLWMP